MAWCTVKQKKSQVQQNPRPHEKAIVSDTGKPENKIGYTQEQEKALRNHFESKAVKQCLKVVKKILSRINFIVTEPKSTEVIEVCKH